MNSIKIILTIGINAVFIKKIDMYTILQKVTSFAEKSAKTSVNLLEKLSDSSANNKDILQEKQALSHCRVH